MSSTRDGILVDHHDWHSASYVGEWIARDVTRDEERRGRLRQMLAAAPDPGDGAITVLDVGGGYGVVTEEVLGIFSGAVVTLQDYSQPMLDQARQRLAAHGGRVKYAVGDLRDRRSARSQMDRRRRRSVRPRGIGDRDP
jgi:trans-aconitate methyltransferase